jgi:hypothetical protein
METKHANLSQVIEGITITEKKLGQFNAIGIAYPEEKKIYIDPRLSRDEMIEILIHEAAHVLLPYLTEETVDYAAKVIGKIVVQKCEEKGYFKTYE